jgi:hypothetical protein
LTTAAPRSTRSRSRAPSSSGARSLRHRGRAPAGSGSPSTRPPPEPVVRAGGGDPRNGGAVAEQVSRVGVAVDEVVAGIDRAREIGCVASTPESTMATATAWTRSSRPRLQAGSPRRTSTRSRAGRTARPPAPARRQPGREDRRRRERAQGTWPSRAAGRRRSRACARGRPPRRPRSDRRLARVRAG